MSPGFSFGTKEYGWPHLVQNPSVRPGRSPRERPTGDPQSDREQNRLRSGTSGLARTIVAGSGRGTSGTWTRPTPSLPRDEVDPDAPELRTDTERPDVLPDSERDSRPDTDLREVDERELLRDDDRELLRDAREPLRPDAAPEASVAAPELPELPEPPEPPDPPDPPEPADPLDATTGARPQVSQYSSPAPMSS